MTHIRRLWGAASARAVRVHWTRHELDLPYEIKPIRSRTGETKTAEFTALNPRQKIPLLEDGDFKIAESGAICAYLSKTYSTPERALHPLNPLDEARWLEWCFYVIAELDSTSLYVMRRHGSINGLAHIYGEAPAVVEKAGEYFHEQLRHVDFALSDGRKFLMGDQFTTADILLTTCLTWAIDYGIGVCDSALPYLKHIEARPAYHRALEANRVQI